MSNGTPQYSLAVYLWHTMQEMGLGLRTLHVHFISNDPPISEKTMSYCLYFCKIVS